MRGVDTLNEPILSSVLYSMQLSNYINLKKKARILLPESCVLIGVVDETGFLEENEVYIKIRRDSFSQNENSKYSMLC